MRGDIVLDNGAFLYKNLSDEVLLKYRRQIGVIFQDYKLMDSKKVYENVAFAMEVCGYKDQYVKKRVPEALKQVGLLIKKDKFVCELS
jgi:cell division transport system ATP-binding protein